MTLMINYNLTIFSPKPDGIYQTGEKVNFYPQAMTQSTLVLDGTIRWKIIKNGITPVAAGKFTTNTIGACASYTADEPCCLECQMTAAEQGQPLNQQLTDRSGSPCI